jgi:hypothetical protein
MCREWKRELTLQMEKEAGVADVEGSWWSEDPDTRHVWCATIAQTGDGKKKIWFKAQFLGF